MDDEHLRRALSTVDTTRPALQVVQRYLSVSSGELLKLLHASAWHLYASFLWAGHDPRYLSSIFRVKRLLRTVDWSLVDLSGIEPDDIDQLMANFEIVYRISRLPMPTILSTWRAAHPYGGVIHWGAPIAEDVVLPTVWEDGASE